MKSFVISPNPPFHFPSTILRATSSSPLAPPTHTFTTFLLRQRSQSRRRRTSCSLRPVVNSVSCGDIAKLPPPSLVALASYESLVTQHTGRLDGELGRCAFFGCALWWNSSTDPGLVPSASSTAGGTDFDTPLPGVGEDNKLIATSQTMLPSLIATPFAPCAAGASNPYAEPLYASHPTYLQYMP